MAQRIALGLDYTWRNTQELAQGVDGTNSLRVDIPKKNVYPHNLRKKGFTYIFLEKDPGFLANMEESKIFVYKLLQSVGKK